MNQMLTTAGGEFWMELISSLYFIPLEIYTTPITGTDYIRLIITHILTFS